jgi:UDP-N-acetylglucosamine--N-acetylmuramyl-(pentapeptide) pyrophosphoryl-undecaprenol N-acetylglucosamine transferase
MIKALVLFFNEALSLRTLFLQERPAAILAFGGYVSAPVLLAARLSNIPYFLQEQNTVPGLVNRLFNRKAQCTFLGFPVAGRFRLRGKTVLTGVPVRTVSGTYADFAYPAGFDVSQPSILICGGSQGAASMNRLLIPMVKNLCADGIQVIWQTGSASFSEINTAFSGTTGLYTFDSIADMYPFYRRVKIVVGRAGASTIAELAYFGIPCFLIPLPWAADNHQWLNAGYVESQDWGYRIAQDKNCSSIIEKQVRELLADSKKYERVCRKALDHSPAQAAHEIAEKLTACCGGSTC